MSKSLIAALVVLAAAGYAAGAEREIESYFRPDQNIPMSNVALKDLHPANGAAWDGFLSKYGSSVQVFLDPRSGTPSGIVGKIPLLGASAKTPTAGIVSDAVRKFVLDNA